jgi:hypothetical protein
MLVVGVAEPENPSAAPGEAESKRRHSEYEESTGSRLAWTAKALIHGIGLFGLTGARERVLVGSIPSLHPSHTRLTCRS